MNIEEKRTIAAKTHTRLTNLERLEGQYFIDSNGCWIWTARKNKGDYGQTHWFEGKKRISGLAYRLSYIVHKGAVPEGLHIDHLCRVHACINPDHLEAVTQGENNRRGYGASAINIRKTHCPKGHPYNEENTEWYARPSGGNPMRYCKLCREIRKLVRRKDYAQSNTA